MKTSTSKILKLENSFCLNPVSDRESLMAEEENNVSVVLEQWPTWHGILKSQLQENFSPI